MGIDQVEYEEMDISQIPNKIHLNNNRRIWCYIYHKYIFIFTYLIFQDISYHILLLFRSLGYFQGICKTVHSKITTSI